MRAKGAADCDAKGGEAQAASAFTACPIFRHFSLFSLSFSVSFSIFRSFPQIFGRKVRNFGQKIRISFLANLIWISFGKFEFREISIEISFLAVYGKLDSVRKVNPGCE